MDNQELKYYKLLNQRYKLQNAINYFTNCNKKDDFDYTVFDYAKEEIVKVKTQITKMKKQYNY